MVCHRGSTSTEAFRQAGQPFSGNTSGLWIFCIEESLASMASQTLFNSGFFPKEENKTLYFGANGIHQWN